MGTPDLHEMLKRLHEELGKTGPLDRESRDLLKVVADDIDALSAPDSGIAGHVPALERLAVEFESEHPAASAALRQLVDALGKAGI
jgi:hypothetical protein